METKDFTPWPITVGHVRIVNSDYVRNNQTVKTTTYLVYLKVLILILLEDTL